MALFQYLEELLKTIRGEAKCFRSGILTVWMLEPSLYIIIASQINDLIACSFTSD
jgi:hypothetical protein